MIEEGKQAKAVGAPGIELERDARLLVAKEIRRRGKLGIGQSQRQGGRTVDHRAVGIEGGVVQVGQDRFGRRSERMLVRGKHGQCRCYLKPQGAVEAIESVLAAKAKYRPTYRAGHLAADLEDRLVECQTGSRIAQILEADPADRGEYRSKAVLNVAKRPDLLRPRNRLALDVCRVEGEACAHDPVAAPDRDSQGRSFLLDVPQ